MITSGSLFDSGDVVPLATMGGVEVVVGEAEAKRWRRRWEKNQVWALGYRSWLATEEMRLYWPVRKKEEGEKRVSGVKKCEEKRTKGASRRLTLVIRISSEQLEQLNDGRGRVELEVGESLSVAGDRYRERSGVKDNGVEKGEVVLDDRLRPVRSYSSVDGDPGSKRGDERRDRSIRVNAVLERRPEVPRLQHRRVVRENGRHAMLVGVPLDKIVGEGIGEGVGAREGREDDVPELNAMRGDRLNEGVVVLGEKLGEVVEEDKEDSHRALIEDSGRLLHLRGREEG